MHVYDAFSLFLLVALLLSPVVTLADDSGANDAEAAGSSSKENVISVSEKDYDKDEIREEDGVLFLTDDNFDKVTEIHDVILVEFYAPWCGHCKNLAPEYSKAAYKLKEAPVPVPLGKVDATTNQNVAQRFDVSGYPTLRFKKDGQWIDYDGPRDAEGIVNWVTEKSDPNYRPPAEAVVIVTQENFENFISSAELVLVEFYAPWCGHCKRLAPEYEKAAKRLLKHDPPIPLGKIDATVEKDLAQKYSVSGYPTLKMFRNGREQEYKGPREERGIIDYLSRQSGEAAKPLSTLNDIKNLMNKETATVIGFFDNLQDPKLRDYMDVANDRRDDLMFGYSLSPDAFDYYKVNPRSVVVFTPELFHTKFEPKYHIFKVDDKTKDEIDNFVQERQLPLVGQYKYSTSKFYTEYNKRYLCLAFYTVDWSFDHKEATQMWRNKVANIAKDNKDIKFAIANEDEYMETLLKDFGLDESGEEFNFACFKNGHKYRMEPLGEFDDEEIRSFLKKLKQGKLAPQVKSQPVPKKTTGPVTVVVGKTFEDIVFDKNKDVLIEMYAPWCGHCKELEPIYKDLAKSMKSEKNLVIAKIDATANDIPDNYAVQGFPTIYFAPANNKEKPLKFDGERTLEGLEKYLKEHATVALGAKLKDEL